MFAMSYMCKLTLLEKEKKSYFQSGASLVLRGTIYASLFHGNVSLFQGEASLLLWAKVPHCLKANSLCYRPERHCFMGNASLFKGNPSRCFRGNASLF